MRRSQNSDSIRKCTIKSVLSFLLCLLLLASINPNLEAMAASTYVINGVSVRYDSVTTGQYNCWIYARDMYYKIWGSAGTSTYSNNRNTSDNMLQSLSKEESLLTIDNLKAFISFAALGAIIRTSNDNDWGLSQDNTGHSQILVQKDSNGFTVFQSNMYLGNGSTGSQERYYTWQEYINSWYNNDHKYIKYIKWPGTHPYISNTATLTFNANGGTCPTNAVTITKNVNYYNLPTASLDGYTFDWWYNEPFSGTAFIEGSVVSDDLTLYAHWSRNGNKVTFNANGGDLPDDEISYSLNGVDVGRAVGYLVVFNNTYPDTNQYGMEIAVDSGGRVTAYRPYGDTTKLTKPQGGFILSGHSNNGSGGATFVAQIHNEGYEYVSVDYSTGIVTAYKNRTAYLANTKYRVSGETYGELPVISRENYIFDGWCSSVYGDDRINTDTAVSQYLLYAQWIPEKEHYIIAFDANGGTNVPASQTKIEGTDITLSGNIPTRDGYSFIGWALSPNATTAHYQPGDPFVVDANTTLYAVWQKVYVSDWSETKPDGVKDELIETRTEYRYSTKETTTSTESSMPGWTQVDSFVVLRESSWSDWAANDPPSGASAAEKRTAYGWYYFECPNCHYHLHGYNDVCWTWCGGCGASTKNATWHQMYDPTNWSVAQDWYGTGKYYTTINGERWFRWDDGGTQTQWRYRTSYLETVYTYERWSDWSDWSDTPAEASDTVNVETRTLYRCVVDEDRVMTLPSVLTRIEAEAFSGIAADAVLVPAGVQSIADDAFDSGIIVIGEPGSYAELYSNRNELIFIPAA